jgi:hypothetical protein
MLKITNIITDKYNTFIPGEFLPIYVEGKLANGREFHAYKAKKAAAHIAKALAPTAHRIDNYFTQH